MRLEQCATAVLLLALAACGGAGEEGKSEGNGSGPSGTSTTAQGSEIKLDPGQWEMTYEITNASAPGMPAGALASMLGKKNAMSVCITPEEASKPSGDIFSGKKGADCSREGFTMAGGRISGTMTCTGGEAPGTVTMVMDGRYSGQSYEMTNKMTTEAQGVKMTIESRASGRRTGSDCAPSKAG